MISGWLAICGRGFYDLFISHPSVQLGQLSTGIIEPPLVIQDADARTISKGMRVSFSALDYTIVGIEPDSTGLTVLLLRPLD